ncbi:TIGR03747 family integrating conjugative element membrane protein [Salmonella enterica]|nr:TIGR03747 family integrating conjugative element membrane protein [Salmonella enterica subsp. enterica serovar Monschaui]EKQ9065436.1 TIGR03747 family integrating conjugative element membrane protein [Salmonella enterica]
MSDTPVQNSNPPKKGLISTPLSWLGKASAALVGSLFFSLVVEWLGIAFFWPELGAEHSHLMMNEELGWFTANVSRSLLMADPAGKLETVLHQVWLWGFVDTGFVPWLEQLRNKPDNAWIQWIDTYIQASVWIIMTFVLRVFILLLTAPLFILAVLVGMVDGLVRRDIRRFGCGYESGFIYHHAKRSVIPVFFLAWIIYLSLPFSVNPCFVLLPAALFCGLTVSIMFGLFKKYM